MRAYIVLVTALIVSFSSVLFARSVTFVTDFPRTDGSTRTIAFSGDVAASTVTGRLAVDGREVDVVGEVTTQAVTGRFEEDGTKVGYFAGRVVGEELHGSYSLNDETGAWTVPLTEIPKAARDVLVAAQGK